MYQLYLQDCRISQVRNQHEAGNKQAWIGFHCSMQHHIPKDGTHEESFV
jgi:hypothetical protein